MEINERKLPIEKYGISRDSLYEFVENSEDENRVCISCKQRFKPDDRVTQGRDVLYLDVLCEECDESGIQARDIAPEIWHDWLRIWGPLREVRSIARRK